MEGYRARYPLPAAGCPKKRVLQEHQNASRPTPSPNPAVRRRLEGSLGRVPNDFYVRVWNILMRTSEVGGRVLEFLK